MRSCKLCKVGKTSKKSNGVKKRRGANGFITFSNKYRKSVVREFPNLPMTEIAKILGQMWRDMSDEEKRRYKRN